jgi:hypothetical protein
MLTYFDGAIAERFENATLEEQAAEVAEHLEWFKKWGSRVRSGHELAWPRPMAAIRSGEAPVMLDGPYLETKEILGGVLILEADSLETAATIANEWPSLQHAGALVEVVPLHQRSSGVLSRQR